MPEQEIFFEYGPEKPVEQTVGDVHPVPLIVAVAADQCGHVGQLGRKVAPVRVINYLLKGDFVVYGRKAGFVLAATEKSNLQTARFRVKTKDKVMAA